MWTLCLENNIVGLRRRIVLFGHCFTFRTFLWFFPIFLDWPSVLFFVLAYTIMIPYAGRTGTFGSLLFPLAYDTKRKV